MSDTDKKMIQLILSYGTKVGVLTRMPHKAIIDELHGNKFENTDWVELEGLDGNDERVPFHCKREQVCAFFITKFTKSMIQPVEIQPQLVSRS